MEIIKRVSDYAMRGLVYMVKNSDKTKIFDLTTVSRNTDAPLPFLQKIFRKLSKAGFLATHRGINGGFSFITPPNKLSLLEIIEVVQGELLINQCFSDSKTCGREPYCGFRVKLAEADILYKEYLSKTTLQDAVDHEISLGKK